MLTQLLNPANFFSGFHREVGRIRESIMALSFANDRQWLVATLSEGSEGFIHLHEIDNFHINSKL